MSSQSMVITFLGTGTSCGVPQLGCDCSVCRSSDPRDRRMRSSVLVETKGKRILIDCGPDFYFQMLHRPFQSFDAVLLTHSHYDHTGGLDDLRPFSKLQAVDVYADADTAKKILMCDAYCFSDIMKYRLPHLTMNEIKAHQTFFIGDVKITPIEVIHGKTPILGYRIDDFVYITDMKTAAESEIDYIKGARLLVLNALRFKPHPTHQSLDEAIVFANKTGVSPVYFTHMSHEIGLHEETSKGLPPGMFLAYDGLTLKI